MEIGTRVRRMQDGQVGWLVEHEGRTQVRLDRKQQLLIVPYQEGAWGPDTQPRLENIHKARICYTADRVLREVMGEYGVKDWREMRPEAQLEWLIEPKDADPLRVAMYRAIRKVLEGK